MDPDRLPGPDALRELAEGGVRGLTVTAAVTAAHPPLEFLRFLRDAAGQRLAVRWHGDLGVVGAAAGHLLPPPDEDPEEAVHRALRLTWRRGPGFVRVCREYGPNQQDDIVFGDPSLVRVFLLAQRPVRPADLGGDDRRLPAAVDALCSAGLLVHHRDLVLAIPVRLMRWPRRAADPGGGAA